MLRLWTFIAIISCSCLSASSDDPRVQITNTLKQWAQDFNSGHQQAVCDLFASDLIASYPGGKDRNYEQMCETLTQAMNHPSKIFHYEIPKIEQLIVRDDIAVVRLIWTLTISVKDHTERIREKGMDVLQKQPDGSWKILISYAFPIHTPDCDPNPR